MSIKKIVDYGVGDSVILKDGRNGTITRINQKDGLFCIVLRNRGPKRKELWAEVTQIRRRTTGSFVNRTDDIGSLGSDTTVMVVVNCPPLGFKIDESYPYPYVMTVESEWLMKQGVLPGMVLEKMNTENVGSLSGKQVMRKIERTPYPITLVFYQNYHGDFQPPQQDRRGTFGINDYMMSGVSSRKTVTKTKEVEEEKRVPILPKECCYCCDDRLHGWEKLFLTCCCPCLFPVSCCIQDGCCMYKILKEEHVDLDDLNETYKFLGMTILQRQDRLLGANAKIKREKPSR